MIRRLLRFFHKPADPRDAVFARRAMRACKRVDEAARQPDLLIPETRTSPIQQGLDL